MKFSLVNGERIEAKPELSGQCPVCNYPTIAKCGEQRIKHWAHKGKRICDSWWENETEWHREWKGHFPEECQEIIQYAEDGEKHIADVKTVQGWVIEFQHSFLKPEERKARNAFYVKLVWVVDGLRRTLDKTQFINSLNHVNIGQNVKTVYLDDCALLREWSGIHAPVFFDFGEQQLWCLLPTHQDAWGYVAGVTRQEFIEIHNKAPDETENFEKFLTKLNNLFGLVSQRSLVHQTKQSPPIIQQKLDPLEMIRSAMLRRKRGINPYAPHRR